MKVVLDTNVIISAAISLTGPPAKILQLLYEKKLQLIIDIKIFTEYQRVLKYPKFNFSESKINKFLDFFYFHSTLVQSSSLNLPHKFPDPDDKIFYEAFVNGQADYLITGNLKHFPKNNSKIVSPKDFLDIYFFVAKLK